MKVLCYKLQLLFTLLLTLWIKGIVHPKLNIVYFHMLTLIPLIQRVSPYRTSIPYFISVRKIQAPSKCWDSKVTPCSERRPSHKFQLCLISDRNLRKALTYGCHVTVYSQHNAANQTELDCFNISGGYSGTHGIHLSLFDVWSHCAQWIMGATVSTRHPGNETLWTTAKKLRPVLLFGL